MKFIAASIGLFFSASVIASQGSLSMGAPINAPKPAPSALVDQVAPASLVGFFMNTCVGEIVTLNPDFRVAYRMEKAGVSPLETSNAAIFLQNSPGQAWGIEVEGQKSVVASRNDQICSVFVQRHVVNTTMADFVKTFSTAAEGFEVREGLALGPNEAMVKTRTFYWRTPRQSTDIAFTITESRDPNTPVTLMMTAVRLQRGTVEGLWAEPDLD